MSSEKDQGLEKVLTELNSNIGGRKAGEKSPSDPSEQTPARKPKGGADAKDGTGAKRGTGAKGGAPLGPDGNTARKRKKKRPPQGPQNSPDSQPGSQPEEKGEDLLPGNGPLPGKHRNRPAPAQKVQILDEGAPNMSDPPDLDVKRPAVRHIAVTAVEVIEDPEEPRPSLPEEEVDPTKPLENIPRPQKLKAPRMSKRDRWTAIIGLMVTFFTIVGIIASVVGVTKFTGNIVNNTAKKKELAREIYPLVIIDTPEFINPRLLDSSAIISASIWAFIIDDNDKSMYAKDDLGHIYVPDADIDLYVRRLFGSEVEIHHQSITDSNLQALYDSENKTYVLESTPKFLPYTPQVDKIQRKGSVYTIDVSYVTPDAMWNMDTENRSINIDKVMQFVLRKNEDSYQVISASYLRKSTAENSSAPDPAVNNPALNDPGFQEDESLAETELPPPSSSVESDESGPSSEETDGESSSGDEEETSSQPDTDSDEDPESRPEESSSKEDEE